MSRPHFLARCRLRRDASVSALLPLLLGEGGRGGESQHSGHHLVWSLFSDGPDRKRDFLWREMKPGAFLTLSERPPVDRHGLFEIDEPKPFTLALGAGDRLGFSLRANPVVRRRSAAESRSAKHDIVMNALHTRPRGTRAEKRFAEIRDQGFAWLERQSANAGFAVRAEEVAVESYQQHRIARKGGANPIAFSTLDFDGLLEVQSPAVFLTCLGRGFGAAKAYGCGLMLVRRA